MWRTRLKAILSFELMMKSTTRIPISSIILDEDIYPRKGIDHRRVGIFAENIRDGFKFEPIEVEPDLDKPGRYRLLDGVHRWSAYKSTGAEEAEAVIKNLDGTDPLLYAAKKAIGPRQLTEDETRDTARRAYNKNTSLSSADIGKAIGRARRTVDSYIADLRAATQLGVDLKIFRMNRLGIPQDRIAKRLGAPQQTISGYLPKMATLPNSVNSDLSRGFTVSQLTEKHGWTEPMVWSLALEDKEDLERFKELGWGVRNDLILDPMAGGGVTPDTCLALNRRCWAFDMADRPETRPEIEPHTWTLPSAQQLKSSTANPLAWPVSSKEKPDLIIFDPPYFDKKAADYDKKSISGLPKKEYLEFLEAFFALLKQNAKKATRLAFINADWRDFQNKPAAEESGKGAILIDHYLRILNKTGWQHTHIIQAPMSAQRFSAVVVSAMQKKRILGVTSRYVIILKQHLL